MRKNKIRILHVAQAAGGVDRYIRMLLKYLDKEKFENILVCSQDFHEEDYRGLVDSFEQVEMIRAIGGNDLKAMACIRLFEGIKYVLPILHPNKKRLALIMCPEEDSASVEWARQKDENWVNKDITSLEFVENIFRLMNWNRECRYKVLGRVANSDQGLCMLFDLEEAIMFTPKPQEYTDPLTGEMKKKQMKFFPDAYKNRIGKSYNDYIADHQMNMFEDFIGYQSSTVLDEPEREAGTTSIPIPQREESENIPLPDLPGQLENVQQSGNEIAKRGMPT